MSVRSLASIALFLPALGAALVGCKPHDEPSPPVASAVASTRAAASSSERDRLRARLAESPGDEKAMRDLADALFADGAAEEAKKLYRRVMEKSRDADVLAHCMNALARLAGPVPPPAPPVPMVLGKSAGGVSVGDDKAAIEAALGPCNGASFPPLYVCYYPSRGMQLQLRREKLDAIDLFHGGRVLRVGEGEYRFFATYQGESPEGVRVGMPEGELLGKVGQPGARYRPIGSTLQEDGSRPVEVWEYPGRFAASIHVDVATGSRFVAGIDIPRLGPVGSRLDGPDAGRSR